MVSSTSFLNSWSKMALSKKGFWIYFIAVILLIILPINGEGFNLNDIMIISIRGDYFFHALVFIPWAFFMPAMHQKAGLWLLLGLLFSTGTEMLQYLLPYRRFNINDLISNSLGILLGIGILIFLMKGLKQRQTTS
jgi:glycopeptide antibiotics resistance protein